MKLQKIGKILILSVFTLSFSYISGQNGNDNLETLIQEAISKSPKIRELESKLSATASRIEIGTNLPDPTLTLGLVNLPTNTFSLQQEPMTSKIVGLSQKIPFPGSLSSASEVKAVDTSIVRQEIKDFENKLRNDVSEFYYSIQSVRENIRLSKESITLLNQISSVVKRKYEVGTASLQNIIQVEVQITRVEDKIEMLIGKENAALASLNALLFRNELSEIQTSQISSIVSYKEMSNSLIKLAELNRPFLQGIKLSEEKAGLMKEHAEYSFYPNFNLGLQYSQRDYNARTGANFNDLFSIIVGVTIPINYGGNKTAQVNEALNLQSLYKDQYNSSLQMLQQSFGKITSKLNELENREKLINQSLLPKAEQAYKASLADYQVGKIDFVNVIQAEDDILKIQTELADIRTDYSKNLSQLEFLTGTNTLNKKRN